MENNNSGIVKNKIFAGLTGGIASGKSAVSGILFELGAYIIDADVLSRKVVEIGGAAHDKIRDAFGDCVFNGVIDRYKLREKVFNNYADLQKLNSITHPLIKNEAIMEAQTCKNDIIIFVVPLLFESGFNVFTSPNITVNCPLELRIKRLVERDNISEQLAKKIIAAQLSDEERSGKADIIITNDCDKQNLRLQVQDVFRLLQNKLKEI